MSGCVDSTERYKVAIKLRDGSWRVVSAEPAPSGSG